MSKRTPNYRKILCQLDFFSDYIVNVGGQLKRAIDVDPDIILVLNSISSLGDQVSNLRKKIIESKKLDDKAKALIEDEKYVVLFKNYAEDTGFDITGMTDEQMARIWRYMEPRRER